MHDSPSHAPHGYDVWTHTEVVPKPAPITWMWSIGPVREKMYGLIMPLRDHKSQFNKGDVTMQLTADQQVDLTITGQDAWGNPVDISGEVTWVSSDEGIVQILTSNDTSATVAAVGPTGTASITVSNDFDNDDTDDFQGSIAIDVIAGEVAEIAISAGTPTDKG